MKMINHQDERQKPNINFGAMGFFQPEKKNYKINEVTEAMEVGRRMADVFVQCSGMHAFEDQCEEVLHGRGGEVLLQSLLLGPKATMEDYCAILNNNAVYASLFLSSTIGLLFEPPSRIDALGNDDFMKILFFLGIVLSVIFNILK